MNENLRGALYMTGSMASFVGSDAILKSVSDEMSLWQAMLVRGLFASALLIGFGLWQGSLSKLPGRRDARLLAIRTVSDAAAALMFLLALFHVDLAIMSAIAQVAPLAMTLAGVWFMGHKVGWRRYLAILTGFVGVLFIIQPGGAGFTPYTLLALASVGCVVVRDLATSRLSHEVSATFAGLLSTVTIMLSAGLLSIGSTWPDGMGGLTVRLGICASILVFGVVFAVSAMRHGEVAVVAPFRYSAILWAVIIGWVVFRELPDGWATTGILLVVASGLYTLWRETRRRAAG
jgi:drug/metabolite transporter (DMT)-like permease